MIFFGAAREVGNRLFSMFFFFSGRVHCHQYVQVPKMEGFPEPHFWLFWGGGETPLHKRYPYSKKYVFGFLHSRYLPEIFGDTGSTNVSGSGNRWDR